MPRKLKTNDIPSRYNIYSYNIQCLRYIPVNIKDITGYIYNHCKHKSFATKGNHQANIDCIYTSIIPAWNEWMIYNKVSLPNNSVSD